MDGNAIVPTEAEHDAHYAHRCCDCDTAFSRVVRPAGECSEGGLCQDCWDARVNQREEDE